jgi:acyl-ACP thioesterase
MHKVGNYTVYYSDTDQNRHMNNTRYPDMYSNFLPLDGKRIRSMSIAYMNEAPLGEVLSVEMAENDGFYYFRTVRSDGKINSEAQIELCEI